ncbi:ABC transporter permease [Anaerocolumna jejuensis]|uniref:ABC transporter permease n=1 Tax=Anaerocolumna jejuensis TaxID=259063 RepID=UPI003F7C650A
MQKIITSNVESVTTLSKEGRSLQATVKKIKKSWQLYLFLMIPVIYYVIFKYIPMAGNIIALRKYRAGGSIFGVRWEGLKYFKQFILDPNFWHLFSNTIILAVLTMIFTFPLPIILALLLNELRPGKFKKFVQTASYLPHFVSVVMLVGMIFEVTSMNGPINALLKSLGGAGINFMQSPGWFRPIYVFSRVWQTTGWGTIMYLSALTAVDSELYEAAKVDGANRWKQTLHVTIPGILPTIITLLVLNIGGLLGVSSEQVLLMYNPTIYETSDVIGTYIYRVGLTSIRYSYAAAIGLFEAVIGFILVTTANSISRKITQTSIW